MTKGFTRLVSFSLSVLLLGSAFAGCGKKEAAKPAANQTQQQSTAADDKYPIKTDVTLTYWEGLTTNLQATASNLGDAPFGQELQKRTGVKVKFLHPAANQGKEQLNVMLASGDLPDIIAYDWYSFPGGPEKAIKDGYILKLNDLIDKNSPNLKKYLTANPETNKMVKTDTGSYYVYPFIRGDAFLQVFKGPIIRNDWLKDLKLEVPATIDDWTTMLKAFKEKKNAEAALSFVNIPAANSEIALSDAFVGAYGVGRKFYMDGNKVKYGPAEPAFKDFIALMARWYKDGLLDKNFATIDVKALDASISSGKTGASIGNTGGQIGKWLPAMKDKDPKFDLVGAPYPTLKKGDTQKFGHYDLAYSLGGCAAITTKSKNAAIAAKFLDYGYSDEGRMFFNFGIEGISYKMENGYPKYTDLLMKNPDKLAPANAMARYIRASYNGPFVQDKRYIEQYSSLPQQLDAIKTWMKTDASKTALPRILPTPEESSEMAKIINEVETFVDETYYKMVLGIDSVDNFDKYMERLKKMNVDRAIAIQQAALDRYSKR